jgi:cell division protein FtsL
MKPAAHQTLADIRIQIVQTQLATHQLKEQLAQAELEKARLETEMVRLQLEHTRRSYGWKGQSER